MLSISKFLYISADNSPYETFLDVNWSFPPVSYETRNKSLSFIALTEGSSETGINSSMVLILQNCHNKPTRTKFLKSKGAVTLKRTSCIAIYDKPRLYRKPRSFLNMDIKSDILHLL